MRDRTKELEKLKKQLAKLQGAAGSRPSDAGADSNNDSEGDDVVSGEDDAALQLQMQMQSSSQSQGQSS